ncbi:MAG: hypothetical protein J2P41_21200 [Blastocatellia bacterium]|nr:hypothetical protein [Blastocatellia bacterium]
MNWRIIPGERSRRGVGTSRRVLCGLIMLVVSPISFLAQSQKPPASKTPPQLPYLAPGRGVPASQIEGVYHHPNWTSSAYTGSRDLGEDWVLFKNGEAWRAPRLPPQDVDVTKAKAAEPKNWGRWKRSGKNIAVCMPDNNNVCVNQEMLFQGPPPRDQHIEGSWSYFSGYVSPGYGSSASSVVTHSLTLHANGRFERTGFVGASVQNQVGKTTSSGTLSQKAPVISGRYHIEGYSLELAYDDGRVERDLFYWVDSPPYKMLRLNGMAYLGKEKH